MRLLNPYFRNSRRPRSLFVSVLADSEDVGERAFKASHDGVQRRQGDAALVVFQSMQGGRINADSLGKNAVRQIAAFLFQKVGEFLIKNRGCPHSRRLKIKSLPMGNTLLNAAYWQRNPYPDVPMSKSSPTLRRQRKYRRSKSGQTLTEYALILAYVSLLCMQALHYLGEIIHEEYVSNQCAFIVAQTYAANVNLGGGKTANSVNAACIRAVLAYLATPSTWQDCDEAFAENATANIGNQYVTSLTPPS
jgi:hypothetical protein